MDMGPGDEDKGDGGMTGVWAWGYGERVEGAAFWGWIELFEKPVHAWAKAVRACSPIRLADNRVVYRSVKGRGVYPLSAVHERRGGFSEPKRTPKWFGRDGTVKAVERAGADISVREEARIGGISEARPKAQRFLNGTNTAKALVLKNGGI